MTKPFQEGDKVYTEMWGEGVVISTSHERVYPVRVKFLSTGYIGTFTSTGVYSLTDPLDRKFNLFHYIEKEDTKPTAPTPPTSHIEHIPDLNIYICHCPNGHSFQIFPQLGAFNV